MIFGCTLFALISLFVVVVCVWLAVRSARKLPLKPSSSVLLVIAHPDDETMFFTPTIRVLRKNNHRIFLLCISTGNFYGQGKIRVCELRRAADVLGIEPSDVYTLDYEAFQDNGQWNKAQLALIIMRYIEMLSVDSVLSFDSRGVSSHSNHISCFLALQSAYTEGHIPRDVQLFVLDTVNIVRKYISLLDVIITAARSPFMVVASPRDVFLCWAAMRAHHTQFVWFRKLFIVFSRYVYLNSYRRISPTKHKLL